MNNKLFCFVCISAFLLIVAIYFVARDQAAPYNYKTLAHLKRIGIMFHMYHEKNGHFPPAYITDSAGNRLHSWRTLLLEIEDPALFAKVRLSEPWDSEHNKALESERPYFYAPPGEDSLRRERFVTNYFVFVDKSSPFPDAKHISLKDISSDLATTILVIEAPGRDINWMEPVDFDRKSFREYFETNWSKNVEQAKYRSGVCMIDDHVQYNQRHSLATFYDMFTIRKNLRTQE
jgi:hypothetical protein